MIPYSPEQRFIIIRKIYSSPGNVLSLSELCAYAAVSRSGYYKWLDTIDERKQKEEKDRKDFDLILEAFQYRGYKKGARQIHMRLLRNKKPVRMNIKKIRRLMDKYGLKCPIRKVNPYRKLAKATYENKVAPNLLSRKFKAYGPRTILLTDITYIPVSKSIDNKRFAYLSVIMDAFTKEILAHVLSDNLKEDFVLETVRILIEKHGISLSAETLIHSDQGVHYTSVKFSTLINNHALRQSMSRRGNCWDNAPQESLWGHMKDEVSDKLYACNTVKQMIPVIDDWVDYYNNDRYQWQLAKLAPAEYYKYVTTHEYPLKDTLPPQIPTFEDIKTVGQTAKSMSAEQDACHPG